MPAPGGTLVVQTAFLGDVILTTPLLARLAEQYGPVDVVTIPAAAGLLAGHPAVREVLPWDKRGEGAGWAGLRAMASSLRARAYARAVLPHRSVRTAALVLLAGIPERIGFGGRFPSLSYSRRIPWQRGGHEVDRLLRLAGPSDLDPPPVRLGLTDADRRIAADWLTAARVGRPFVVLAPGSAWGTKRWPGFGELAAALSTDVVVVGGPEDTFLAENVAAAAPGRAHVAAGQLPLRAATALLAEAAVVVTNDSAPLHLAQAVDVPVVAIFGPTSPDFGFGPRGPRDRVVELENLVCRPCSPHGPEECPLGHHRCMRELPVADVLEAVTAVLSSTGG